MPKQQQLLLSVSWRPTSTRHHLFVRLPTACAERLRDEALQQPTLPTEYATGGQYWSLSSSSSLEFLPLVMELPDSGERFYLSYNGGEIECNEEDWRIIELQQVFFQNTKPSRVLVEALPFVRNADQVFMEPLSVEDWELLETYAEDLEAGDLLQQISIVYPDQVVPLQVEPGVLANVRVLATSFGTHPHDANDVNMDPPCCCMRLVADTEVVISPKPAVTLTEPVLRVLASFEEYSEVMQDLASSLDHGSTQDRLQPCSVAVHPNTLSKTPGWIYGAEGSVVALLSRTDTVEMDDPSSASAVASVIPSTLVSEDAIVIHPLVRLKLNCRLFVDHVQLRILNHVERDCRMKRARALVASGRAKWALRPMALAPSRRVKRWRMPDVIAQYQGEIHVDSQEKRHLSLPNDQSELPIDVGGMVALPWRHASIKETEIFRVDLVYESPELAANCTDSMMVLSGELFALMERCPNRQTEKLHMPDGPMLVETALPVNVGRDFMIDAARYGLENSGTVLCGSIGCGKTHSALMMSSYARFVKGYSTVYLDCRKLRDSRTTTMKEILAELAQVFEDACASSPCTIILDDLDEIVPSLESEGSFDGSARSEHINPASIHQAKLLGDALCHILQFTRSKSRIFTIATCSAATSLTDSVLNVISGSSRQLHIPLLSAEERETLFLGCLERHTGTSDSRHNRSRLATGKKTEGYLPRDLEKLALRVSYRFRKATTSLFLHQLFDEEVKSFVPSSHLSAAIETGPTPRWSYVGGLGEAKEALAATVIRPSLYQRIFNSSKVRLPRGFLLYGPSGCGKTYLVPALARECGYRLVTCRGPELLDKYIGASEANVRALFARAAAVAPSILFLDELDALAPRRGSDHTGVTDRIVNQLLTFLDGVEGVQRRLYIVAATSRPDKVDPALLRPGRLEQHIYVGTPTSTAEASDVLSKVIIHQKYPVDKETLGFIQSGQFLSSVWTGSSSAVRLTAADMKGACNTAQMLAVHEALDAGKVDETVLISRIHLSAAFASAEPSLAHDEYRRLQAVYALFKKDKTLASDTGDVASETGTTSEHDKPLRVALK